MRHDKRNTRVKIPSLIRSAALVVLAGLLVATHTAAESLPLPSRAFRSFAKGPGNTGLPASTVVSLHTDIEGTVWIATFTGVARVEHGQVERVTDPNGPGDGSSLRVIDRRAGGVYVSATAGLYTLIGQQWTFSPTPTEFTYISEDGGANLVALDRRGVLYWRAAGATEWKELAGDADATEFRALATLNDGNVVAAGRTGLVRVANGAIAGPLGDRPAAALTTVIVASSGRVWAGGEDGRLHSWQPDTGWQSFAIPEWDAGRIRAIAEDRRGRIWAGGDNGRAAFGNETTPFERWTPEVGLKTSAITAIAGDATGGVWFGFNGSGLQQWLGEAWTHRTFWRAPGDVDPPITFSVRPTADGGFVAAVFNRGVWRWDGKTMAAYGREQGITEDVRFAIEPEPGVIWAAARFAIFAAMKCGWARPVALRFSTAARGGPSRPTRASRDTSCIRSPSRRTPRCGSAARPVSGISWMACGGCSMRATR